MPTLYESDRIAEFENVRDLLSLGYKVHRLPRKTASITYANILTTKSNVYVPQYSRYKIESSEQLAVNQRVQRLYRKRQWDQAASLLSKPIKTSLVEADAEVARDNRRALEVLQRLFPEKRVIPANADETIYTRGSWHCLTHELPERL
jgi:agmatine/peptidylarginine deiminase